MSFAIVQSSRSAGSAAVGIDQLAREIRWRAGVVRGTNPMVSPGAEGLQDMRLAHAILASVAVCGRPAAIDRIHAWAADPAKVADPPA